MDSKTKVSSVILVSQKRFLRIADAILELKLRN